MLIDNTARWGTIGILPTDAGWNAGPAALERAPQHAPAAAERESRLNLVETPYGPACIIEVGHARTWPYFRRHPWGAGRGLLARPAQSAGAAQRLPQRCPAQ